MKTSHAIIVVIIVLLAGVFIFKWSKDNQNGVLPGDQQTSSIVGCYNATTGKDVYTMNIQSDAGGNVSGTLAFKNFEKDSSRGTFKGVYADGILLADYSFTSEGMDSVMQVIFKKSGDDFIRGYGDVHVEGNNARFTNLHAITYDASSTLAVFKRGACPL